MKFDPFGRLGAGPDDAEERKIIAFVVAEIRCGLDIMSVREIVNPSPITPMPTAPPYVLGAADHRSSLVPVVNLRARLGFPSEAARRPKWVLALSKGRDVALVVDVVSGVVTVGRADKRDRHPLMDGTDVGWVRNVYGGPAGLLFELDVDAVLGLAGPLAVEP